MGELLRSSPEGNNFHPHQVEAGLTRLQAFANDPLNGELSLVDDQIKARRWHGIVARSGQLALFDDLPSQVVYPDSD